MVSSEERITEMEQRIADLEAELRSRQRSRLRLGPLLRELVPSEARSHMLTSQRHRLMAMRVYLDRAIARLDREATETSDSGETL